MFTLPKLFILDEPFNGLDPDGIKEIRKLLKRLSTEHRITMLISSHNLGEIEQIADTILIIQEGHLIEEFTIDHIHKLFIKYIELKIGLTDMPKTAYLMEHCFQINHFKVLDEQTMRVYDQSMTTVLIENLASK